MCIYRSLPNESVGVSPYGMLYGHKTDLATMKLKLELAKLERKQPQSSLQMRKEETAIKKEDQEREAALREIEAALREREAAIRKEEKERKAALRKEEQEREAALKEREVALKERETTILREQRVRKFANDNLLKAQERMKTHFGQSSKLRKFKPGDFVLAYFPILGSPLQNKFSGPYRIKECRNNHNYVLQTPDWRRKTQLCHVNLLKQYQVGIDSSFSMFADEGKIMRRTKTEKESKRLQDEIDKVKTSPRSMRYEERLRELHLMSLEGRKVQVAGRQKSSGHWKAEEFRLLRRDLSTEDGEKFKLNFNELERQNGNINEE
ncbi:trichohyalin-like [Procambarus clarkii]|uniref:trichohyalin-like n=1 Tax=Procambarus clarkii TaxID=6728 RepID=UPI0037431894